MLTGIAAFGGNSEGVLATFTLEFLGPARKREYGRIRLFTSVGWGLSSSIVGVVDDHFGFVYNLYGYLGLAVFQQALQMLFLPRRTRAECAREAAARAEQGQALQAAIDELRTSASREEDRLRSALAASRGDAEECRMQVLHATQASREELHHCGYELHNYHRSTSPWSPGPCGQEEVVAS